jgi:hypothetical protein
MRKHREKTATAGDPYAKARGPAAASLIGSIGMRMDILAVKWRLAPSSLARRRGAIGAAVKTAGCDTGPTALEKLCAGLCAWTSDGP